MAKIIEGHFSAKGKKFAIVVSRFNDLITSKLLQGALDCIVRHEGKEDDVTVAWCPGAFELSQVARALVQSKKYDAVICLGCVIRGATSHFDYVAGQAARGIGHLSTDSDVPVIFGVLTTDTIEQALERAGTKAGNKGWDAALSAMEMTHLLDKI